MIVITGPTLGARIREEIRRKAKAGRTPRFICVTYDELEQLRRGQAGFEDSAWPAGSALAVVDFPYTARYATAATPYRALQQGTFDGLPVYMVPYSYTPKDTE